MGHLSWRRCPWQSQELAQKRPEGTPAMGAARSSQSFYPRPRRLCLRGGQESPRHRGPSRRPEPGSGSTLAWPGTRAYVCLPAPAGGGQAFPHSGAGPVLHRPQGGPWVQRWSPPPCHAVGALETLADQMQVRTPPHQDGALGRLHSEEEPQRRPWQPQTALNGQRLCAGDRGQGAQDPAVGRRLPRAPRGQRTKVVMSLGEQEGAPGSGCTGAGLCWMCRSSPSSEGKTDRTAPQGGDRPGADATLGSVHGEPEPAAGSPALGRRDQAP